MYSKKLSNILFRPLYKEYLNNYDELLLIKYNYLSNLITNYEKTLNNVFNK